MLSAFFMVARQVIILFILISLGAIANKTGLIKQSAIKGMTELVLYFVTPCVILKSFQREMNPSLVKGLLITAVVAFLSHFFGILLSRITIKDKDESAQTVMRFGSVFGNCGFMSLPIEDALFGSEGVFYGAVFIAVFNVLLWTYGLTIMSDGKERITAKKLILNPGILGVILGIIVFVLGIKLPVIIESPIEYMAALNTPLPMIIIGFYLGNLSLAKVFEHRKQYISYLIRLVAVPLFGILILLPFHVSKTVFVVCAIANCAPVAATTAMFSSKFDRNATLAAQMVSMSTLISIVTMPLIVAFAQYIA